jgi:cyclase
VVSSLRISARGTLVSFDDPYFTNVYIIFADEFVFVLDTFLGDDPMQIIRNIISNAGCSEMPLVIFNSHADYDHYWGNGAFKKSIVTGHERCRARIISESAESLLKYAEHKRGHVEIVPPNLVFQKSLKFIDEEISFFYTPGHTIDSSSCFDERDGVLFVGDNVESPIPYLNHPNFEQYKRTLEAYLELDWKTIITGHDPSMEDANLIRQNIGYLRRFKDWNFDLSSMGKAMAHRHIEHNLVVLRDALMASPNRHEFQKHLEDVKQFTS